MASKLTLGEYVVFSGSTECAGWSSDALRAFCQWLVDAQVYVPLQLHVWERYHFMWATGQALGQAVAHAG
jgi:hypothetical protein